MEARPAVQLTVTDESGAPLPSAASVRAVVREGAYADTARVIPGTVSPTSFPIAFERPGTYRVEVTANGYTGAIFTGVQVDKTPDGCHVRTVPIAAHLRRL